MLSRVHAQGHGYGHGWWPRGQFERTRGGRALARVSAISAMAEGTVVGCTNAFHVMVMAFPHRVPTSARVQHLRGTYTLAVHGDVTDLEVLNQQHEFIFNLSNTVTKPALPIISVKNAEASFLCDTWKLSPDAAAERGIWMMNVSFTEYELTESASGSCTLRKQALPPSGRFLALQHAGSGIDIFRIRHHQTAPNICEALNQRQRVPLNLT